MPITHDLVCSNCGKTFDDYVFERITHSNELFCGECGGLVNILPAAFGKRLFKGGFYSELTGNKETWFSSRRQLKDAADKANKYSEYVS